MNKFLKINFQISSIVFLILLAVLSRLIPHPPNFTPIAGIAIFAANKINNKQIAILLPLICLFISDLFIGFSLISFFVYFSFVVISLSSVYLKINTLHKVFLGSGLFFVISNFGVWIIEYPLSLDGFIKCYFLAIPFYLNTLFGDLFYTFSLFISFRFATKYFYTLVR
jgi:hypothetical protein|tara:strand:- start:2306 stop:2809 length:504 start_codon:yes stop_codon:yes gene_type:complete